MQLVDVAEDFRDGSILFGGNRLVDVDVLVECLGQRFAFDNRDVVLQCQAANALGQDAGSLGHARSALPSCAGSYLMATASSVGLVTTTSACGTDDLQAIHDQLPLDLPSPSRHVRIALQHLHFFADFLGGHPQILLEFPFLEAVVEDGQDQQGDADLQAGSKQDVEQQAADLPDRCVPSVRMTSQWSQTHQPATASTTQILNRPNPSRTTLVSDTSR